jgi:predicted glycosyltransferase
MLPDDVDLVKLPSFENFDDPSGWLLRSRVGIDVPTFRRARAQMISTFMRAYEPDLFIVNHLPYGADGELVDLLSTRRHGNLLTLRGVLFDVDKTYREFFAPGPSSWILDHFDQINVHTHPDVFRLEESYQVPPEMVDRMVYTGYLASPPLRTPAEARKHLDLDPDARVLVVAMGGGQGAGRIWESLTAAIGSVRAQVDRVRLVTGPYLEPGDMRALQHAWADDAEVDVVPYERELSDWINASDLFVGAAGANMIGEVLAAGANSILVPRQVRESEQRIHAGLLAERGLTRLALPAEIASLSFPETLVEALREPLIFDGMKYLAGDAPYPLTCPDPDRG